LNKVWIASVALIISMSIVGLSSESAFAGGSVIDISKSVDKPIIISGTEVKYTYNFQNNGLQTLLNCSLEDSQLGPIPINAASVRLSPGETGTATFVTNIFITTVNDATLSCNLDGGTVVTMTSNTATVTVVNPAVTIDKTSNKDGTETGIDPLLIVSGTNVFSVYKVTRGDISPSPIVALNNCQIRDDNGTPLNTGSINWNRT